MIYFGAITIINYIFMPQRAYLSEKNKFTEEEDKMIAELYHQNLERPQDQKLKWNDIAQIIARKIQGSHRSGKQCRQRWFNQLDPTIKHSDFTHKEIQKLFKLQNEKGNRWAEIAREMPGRTDNNIKNFFYSALRRSLRHINRYLASMRCKFKLKPFKNIILTKILTINDEKYRQKLDIKNDKAMDIAEKVKNMLIQLSQVTDDKQENKELDQQQQKIRTTIIQLLQDFNKHCKKRKQKKCTQDTIRLEQIYIQQENQYSKNSHINKSRAKKINIKNSVNSTNINGKKRLRKVNLIKTSKRQNKNNEKMKKQESLEKQLQQKKMDNQLQQQKDEAENISSKKPYLRSMSIKIDQKGGIPPDLSEKLKESGLPINFKQFGDFSKIKKQQSIIQNRSSFLENIPQIKSKKVSRLDSNGSDYANTMMNLGFNRVLTRKQSNRFVKKQSFNFGDPFFQGKNSVYNLNPLMTQSQVFNGNKLTESAQFRISAVRQDE